MTAGEVTAIYAAVVATATAGFQVFQWWHRRRPHVSVKLRMGFLVFGGETVDAYILTATNRGDDPVRVEGAGLFLQDGSGRTCVNFQQPPGAGLPGVIAPKDSAMTYFRPGEVAINPQRPVVAFVDLATGEKVRSKAKRLLAADWTLRVLASAGPAVRRHSPIPTRERGGGVRVRACWVRARPAPYFRWNTQNVVGNGPRDGSSSPPPFAA